jgi:tetratricopeptide (TPR) repeat protein
MILPGAALFVLLAAVTPASPDPVASRGDAEPAAGAGASRLAALWDQGRAAYADERWAEAAAAFQALVAAGVDDASVHYDLGNALFRLGRFGPAIAAYERALLLEPGAADAERNLDAAERAALAAARDDPAAALGRAESSWVERLVRGLTADTWATLFAAAWLAGFAGWTVRRLVRARARALRAVALGLAIAGLAAAPLAGAGLWARASLDAERDRAVMVSARTTLRQGPSTDHPPAFDVREGIRVKVLGEDAGWLKVRLTDGLEGWAPPGSAERI